MSKNKNKRKKPKAKARVKPKLLRRLKKARENPGTVETITSMPATYVCCTEADGTPIAGCGHKFVEPYPRNVSCPKCGNLYVKWTDYQNL